MLGVLNQRLSPMRRRISSRRLFVDDLLRRMADIENGAQAMNALLYRVLAKRLGQACAGLSDLEGGHFSACKAQMAEQVQNRYFDEHGHLGGPGATGAEHVAALLWGRLGVLRRA